MAPLIHLFAEDVSPLLWAIGLAELVLVIALVSTGRGRILLWMAALGLLALVLFVAERLIVTDRERIETAIGQMAEAVRGGDVDGLVDHLAPGAHYGGLDREGIRRLAASVLGSVRFDRIAIADRKIELSPDGKRGTAEFRAYASGNEGHAAFNSYPTRWVVTFQEQPDGTWRALELTELQAFGPGGERLPPRNP